MRYLFLLIIILIGKTDRSFLQINFAFTIAYNYQKDLIDRYK